MVPCLFDKATNQLSSLYRVNVHGEAIHTLVRSIAIPVLVVVLTFDVH